MTTCKWEYLKMKTQCLNHRRNRKPGRRRIQWNKFIKLSVNNFEMAPAIQQMLLQTNTSSSLIDLPESIAGINDSVANNRSDVYT
jgi:hypothetical protein